MKKAIYGSVALSGMVFIIIFMIYPNLPDRIPIHWDLQGIDGYANKNMIYIYPSISLLLNLLLFGTRLIDPKKHNYKRFQNTFIKIIWLMNIMMTFFILLMLYEVCNPNQIDLTMFIQFTIGITICLFGNWMPKIKQNYFIGIKTPWSCRNENNWIKTHRFTGRLWFLCGILWMICAFLPIPLSLFQMIMFILLIGLPIIYSYVMYYHLKKEKHYD